MVNKDVVLASQQEALVQRSRPPPRRAASPCPMTSPAQAGTGSPDPGEPATATGGAPGLKISDTQLEQAIQSIAADNKMNLEQLRAQLEREG